MSESYKIKGRVTVIKPMETFGSGFTKQPFVINDGDGDYSQDIQIEGIKDGCDKVAALNVGDLVEVEVNIRGREWEGRHFVNLQMWKLNVVEAAPTGAAATPPPFDPADDVLDEDVPF